MAARISTITCAAAVVACGLATPAFAQFSAVGSGATLGTPPAATQAGPVAGGGATPAAAGALAPPSFAQAQQAGAATTQATTPTISPEEADKKALQDMFKGLMQEINPLTPGQEIEVRRKSEEDARARARPAPAFSNVMVNISLDPSSDIPIIQMDLGQPSTISFIDRTGEPWPIKHCDWTDGFKGDSPPDGSHAITLQATHLVENGAIVCLMKDLTTPVNLRLAAGDKKHFLRVDARIPRNGPNPKPAPYDLSGAALMQAGSDDLNAFLYGIPPAGAEALEVEGGSGQTKAWRYGGSLFIRTPMVLLSPGPRGETRLEGVNVYVVDPLPDLTFEYDGHDVDIRIKGARVVRAAVPKDVLSNEEAPGPAMTVISRDTPPPKTPTEADDDR